MRKKVTVIGSGFSGLAAACVLAKNGYAVTVYEKNSTPGGRARQLVHKGFTFDLGPTWYWLPDVFESFFAYFNKKPSDYYQLYRLDPAYRTYFGEKESIDVPAGLNAIFNTFEQVEKGSAKKLKKFIDYARIKYKLGIENIVYKPAHSFIEFIDIDILKTFAFVKTLTPISKVIRKAFKDMRLIRILEFPVIFLGATPQKTPSLYSLMNYADLALGTWYPVGGMYSVVDGMYQLAVELGVKFNFNSPIDKINSQNGVVKSLMCNGEEIETDMVIASADYHHVESMLLDEKDRNYNENYWETRDMAPSALLFYIGVNKKLEHLEHHNLFFDTSFEKHAEQIYDKPQWPDEPALYVSVSSKTDHSCAPEGKENVIILIPVAPGLKDTEQVREKYFHLAIERIEKITQQKFKEDILFWKSYAQSDFINDYHSFRGNAYGLANTLKQTGFLKPKLKSKKLSNLFFAGQLTTPGPGVPPAIISGMVSANEAMKQLKKK